MNDCDVNAQCSAQGSKVSCACKPDYEGDGRICVPKNPCSNNNGGCPVNSTICVFEGPNKVRTLPAETGSWNLFRGRIEPDLRGLDQYQNQWLSVDIRTFTHPVPLSVLPVCLSQSRCECMFGMSPVGGSAEFGCELASACLPDTCDPTAVCHTGADGQPRSDTKMLPPHKTANVKT